MGKNTNYSTVVVSAPHEQNIKASKDFAEEKVCDIPPTNPRKKPDAYKSMIPPPKTVLKYDISQMDTKLKAAVKTGIAQMHVTQTDAKYELPPPGYVFPEDATDDRKVRHATGGPPVWKFVEETWWDKVARQQKLSRQKFYALQIENRKYDKMIFQAAHRKLLNMVGPEWFQELSTDQLETINNLKTCILKDRKFKTTRHIEENMIRLGLMSRPKVQHLKTALDNCCQCPVEFLLILYQLMNKKRTEYSVNDRLLLSGVVHLTIRETLKELHIRIPSPPPPRKPKKFRTPIPKRARYKSPYLEPFDFVPCPPKHTGVYKNNHIQYPESPYFSYLTELKNEKNFSSSNTRELYVQKKQSGITIKQHNEILGELRTAQAKYQEMVGLEKVPYLLKPSIYIPCDHGIRRKKAFGGEEENNDEAEGSPKDISISVAVKVTTNYNTVEEIYEKMCECNVCVQKGPIPCPTIAPIEEVDEIAQSESNSSSLVIESRPQSPKPIEKPPSPPKISTECKCKNEAEKIIEKNLCQCVLCKKSRATEEINKTNNVEVDHIKPTCDCLKKYKSRIAIYEEMKKRFAVQKDLMSLPEQFVVGGVTQGPDGQPVYMLSGVVPDVECSCAKIYLEQLKEQERLANMPELPQGKPKYVVCGVHPTDKGNVFVLAGAVDGEECPCQKIYKSYEKRHNVCLDAYDKYIKKIETDVDEYTQDIETDTRFDPASTRSLKGSGASSPNRISESQKEDENTPLLIVEAREDNKPDTKKYDIESKLNANVNVCDCGRASTDMPSRDTITTCTCSNPPYTSEEQPQPCSCDGAVDLCICGDGPICTCDDEESVAEEEKPEQKEEEEEPFVPLQRFIILDKIPCKYNEQTEILKNALEMMAKDGFPLAKLPDSWKLPIFKLWMQMRCGKYWTQEDRVDLFNSSMAKWHHTNHCKGKIKQGAKLGMPPEQSEKYTWTHANTVKRIALKKETSYYREIKQIAINEAREFYPTTYSYELPTPAFRDCYFAYLPPKEDSCSYWRPWYEHEYKK